MAGGVTEWEAEVHSLAQKSQGFNVMNSWEQLSMICTKDDI